MNSNFQFELLGVQTAEAGKRANELASFLTTNLPGIRATRDKSPSDTMDLGTIVSVALGSAAITELAQGIAVWLTKRHNVDLSVSIGGNRVSAKKINSKDAVKITEILANLQQQTRP